MRNEEKGFTYPLTLIVLLLFLTFFTVRIEQLMIDRKMAHETSLILQQENYFLSSIKKVEQIYQSGTTIPSKGTFLYINGKMEFQSEKAVGNVQRITFTLRLNSGETVIGRGYFNTSIKRNIKWVEMK
jgi:competence protein ComGG